MDTNQFTQQLVQFAQLEQVEQQMKSNDQLSTLVSLDKTAQSTTALVYVGSTVVVDGSTAPLSKGSASWTLNVTKPATPPSRSRIRPTRPPIPAPSRSIRVIRISLGTAAATTASFGRTTIIRSAPAQWMPTVSRSAFRPKCRLPSTRSTSHRIRRFCRSTDRTTPWTRSSGSCVPVSPPRRRTSAGSRGALGRRGAQLQRPQGAGFAPRFGGEERLEQAARHKNRRIRRPATWRWSGPTRPNG